MGADIRGAGTDVIKIYGVDHLHGTTYSIIPDQIEAGTYMVAIAATGGDAVVAKCDSKAFGIYFCKTGGNGCDCRRV